MGLCRAYTASHQNAFSTSWMRRLKERTHPAMPKCAPFSINGCKGPNGETYVDLSHTVAVCGSEACQPIPVPLRPTLEFLWQIDPFQLAGGGDGTIGRLRHRLHSAVLDGALLRSDCGRRRAIGRRAEWRGRSRFAGFAFTARNLAPGVAQASAQPLPLALGGVALSVTDAGRRWARRAAALRFAGSDQFPGSGRHGGGSGDIGGCGSNVHRRHSTGCRPRSSA